MSNANNANNTAYPIMELDTAGSPEVFHEGLTKRETFAMNAPSMPDWFRDSKYCQSLSPSKVLSEQEQKDFTEYCRENYAYDRFDEGMNASQKFAKISGEHYLEHNKKVYFEWCCYYADGLLEKLQEKL
jgi:hypothetical protein